MPTSWPITICYRVARFLAPFSDGPSFYSPINEISFLAWAICESRLIHPYVGTLKDCGFDLKRQFTRAAIAGCEAILAEDPRARIVQIDPLVHVVAPHDRPDLTEAAAEQREFQFQAWDMLSGRMAPELGGAPRYLDIIGINYYHSNQWEYPTDERLHWHLNDPRRLPLSELLYEVEQRYQRPLFIAETSHVGEGRGAWIQEIAQEVLKAKARGVRIEGICLYPIIDRPDWELPEHWHNSGLWDIKRGLDGSLTRVLYLPYARDLRHAQHLLASALGDERCDLMRRTA